MRADYPEHSLCAAHQKWFSWSSYLIQGEDVTQWFQFQEVKSIVSSIEASDHMKKVK